MNWEDALQLVNENIQIGTDLDNLSQYRFVEQIPPYECYRYNFNGEHGFKISVGNNQTIDVPMQMLQTVFQFAKAENSNIYNRMVLIATFPRQANNKPCYIHVIGNLFVCAGVAIQNGNRNYNLL